MSSLALWLWYSFALALGLGALWLLDRSLFRDRSRGRRRCPKCWYSMEGVPGTVCPECGKDAKHEKGLMRTRRRWIRGMCGGLLLVTACVAGGMPHFLEGPWFAWVPSTVLMEVAPVEDLSNPSTPRPGWPDSPLGTALRTEIDMRLRVGRLWRWQSQRYLDRTFRENGVDFGSMIRAPGWWVRDVPMPVIARIDVWPSNDVQIGTGEDNWSTPNEIMLKPPHLPDMSIPFKLFESTHAVYEDNAHLEVLLFDRVEGVFDTQLSPDIEAAVTRRLRPTVERLRDTWSVITAEPDWPGAGRSDAEIAHTIAMLRDWAVQISDDKGKEGIARQIAELDRRDPSDSIIIAVRVDVVIDGRVLGRASGLFCAGGHRSPVKTAFHYIDWLNGEPADFDPSRATLVVQGDLRGAWDLWSRDPFATGKGRPRAWAGRFECPAVREEKLP